MSLIIDGSDLGVGILFTATSKRNRRDRMMPSVAPIRDGNENRLILTGPTPSLAVVSALKFAPVGPCVVLPITLADTADASLVSRGTVAEDIKAGGTAIAQVRTRPPRVTSPRGE